MAEICGPLGVTEIDNFFVFPPYHTVIICKCTCSVYVPALAWQVPSLHTGLAVSLQSVSAAHSKPM